MLADHRYGLRGSDVVSRTPAFVLRVAVEIFLDDLLPPRESVPPAHGQRLWQIRWLTSHATCNGSRSAAQFHNMTVELIRYDAARRAIAAAYRIDEVKHIHDKATALLAYAKQAGDYELQNKAAEIRILAERRAGELLVDMQATGQRRAKERGRPTKVSSPTTLPKLGITRDQSSKWQRMAKLIDDA